jgi:hypothetical protein
VQRVLAPLRLPEDPFSPTPNFGMSTPGGSSIGFGPTTWVNMNTGAEAYTLLDNVSKVLAHHTLKAGFIYRLEHTFYEGGFPTGFNFSGDLVTNPNTGLGASGLSQFMLGTVGSSGRSGYSGLMFKPYWRNRYWGFFFQHDFRITPRFTLNFGLRYDIFGIFKLRHNQGSYFCFECPNSLTGLHGKVIYEGDPEFPKGHDLFPSNKTDLAPRVNFAWTPFGDRKTVIRGGYDIFYTNSFTVIIAPGQASSAFPGWAPEYDWNGSFYPNQCAPLTGQCVSFPLSDTTTDKATLTTPPLPSEFPAQKKDPLLGLGALQTITKPAHDPMVQSWGLEIQRELPGNMMVSIGYVGSHGTHLAGEGFRSLNYVHTTDRLKYRRAINATIPITDVYSGQTAQALQTVYGSSELTRSLLLKDYPFHGAFNYMINNMSNDGTTVYHGMNLRVQKRYSQGFDFIAAYTFSKKSNNAMTTNMASMLVDPLHWAKAGGIGGRAGALGWNGGFGGQFQDIDNKNLDRAIAADDITHMFNLAGSYELPFGAGKPLLNKKGPLNAVVGGWRLTGNFNAQGGCLYPSAGPATR